MFPATSLPARRLFLLLAAFVLVAMTASCGDDDNGDPSTDSSTGDATNDSTTLGEQPTPAGTHLEAGRVELISRGIREDILAIWTPDVGWTDADGDSIDRIPTPVASESVFQELTAGGPRSIMTPRFYDGNGELVEMATLERDPETDERVCTEYSARFAPVDNDTDIIAWPNIPHPEPNFERPPHLFALLPNGDLVALYHCDHIYFYPLNPGTVGIRFLLWHVDHSDDFTDPIDIEVFPAD